MTPKEFGKYVARDLYCLHCGNTDTLIPNHRANRQMGGSKKRNHPANIVVLCSLINGLIESDAKWAEKARKYGWKLSPWDDPFWVPVFDRIQNKWWLLDDEFGRTRLSVLSDDRLDRPF
jgi:hypothetical protein